MGTGTELRTLTVDPLFCRVVEFGPDGKTLASGSGDKNIKLWDVETGKELQTLIGESSNVLSVAFSPTVRLWLREVWVKR